jgi:hypothetical protein
MMLSKYEGLKAYWMRRNTTHKVLGLWKLIISWNFKLRNVELVYNKYTIFS